MFNQLFLIERYDDFETSKKKDIIDSFVMDKQSNGSVLLFIPKIKSIRNNIIKYDILIFMCVYNVKLNQSIIIGE